MNEINEFKFSILGWMDICDVNYRNNNSNGWFKIYGKSSDGKTVDGNVYIQDKEKDIKPFCSFLKNNIFINIALPNARYNQIYTTLQSCGGKFKDIEAQVSYSNTNIGDSGINLELELISIIFTSRAGKFPIK